MAAFISVITMRMPPTYPGQINQAILIDLLKYGHMLIGVALLSKILS